MSKRIFVFVLALLLLGLVGCGNDPLPTQTTVPTTGTPSTAGTTLPTETTLPEETEPVLAVEWITVTDVVPAYDIEAKETFFVPHEQQNPQVYTSEYIHLARGSEFYWQDNVLLVCTGEQLMKSENHYEAYTVEDGEIKKLQSGGFYREYQFNGARYIIDFSYARHNGNVIYTFIKNNYVVRAGKNLGDYRLLLMLEESLGQGMTDKVYPVVLDMTTGGITDYLQGLTDAQISLLVDRGEEYRYIGYTVLDENRFLVHKGNEELYYVDKEQQVVEAMHALVGGSVYQFSVAEDALICWTVKSSNLHSSDVWKINLEDFSAKKLLEKIPLYPRAASFAFYTVEEKVYFYDALKESGGLIEVPEGWDFENYQISPDGRKAFILNGRGKNKHLLVFDYDTMVFTEIIRENQNGLRDGVAYWTKDGRIYIGGKGYKDYYVYTLTQ